MRDEWIAVARGLKCLSISITLGVAALLLAFAALLVNLMLISSGVPARPPVTLLVLPAGAAAVIAWIFSRIARLFLLRVPGSVPGGRFSALACIVLELVGQTALGIYLALIVIGIWIPERIEFPWVLSALAIGFVGWVFFQRTLIKIADHICCFDAKNHLVVMWILPVFGVVFSFLSLAFEYFPGESLAVLLSVIGALSALFVFALAIRHYLRAARDMRMAVLHAAMMQFSHDGPYDSD